MEKGLNNISVILPVYKLDDTGKQLFSNAIKSVEQQTAQPNELLIVVIKDSQDSEFIKGFDFGILKNIVTIIENDGDTDFASQFNLGVSKAKYEWVSLIEQDDEYASIWLSNFIKYRSAYPNINVFLPLIVDVNDNSSFVGLTNEAVWANSFSDELGVLDNSALLAYQNFNIDGMVIKKSVFEELGGMKKNIKLTFVYEFLLRLTFKGEVVMVIPKYGYKHMNQRVGSLFHSYRETMNPVESGWWLAQAKKEYYFQKDREITYTEQV